MKSNIKFFIIIILTFKVLCVEEATNPDNELFKKLRNFINLIDQLRDCGVNEYIKLPRICSLGTQSSGKSSVLESIVGLDFLPRGEGVVTRRPLELRLYHIESDEPWAIFEERNKTKYTNFTKVKETIEELTDELCTDKDIVDKPIILSVYSKTCPDLTIIDLPGITRVPVGRQPENIEDITKNMAKRYIDDPLTIILCVIAANSDIATSDGLKLAKEIDKEGIRTLGVLTKLDIMDEGTDARKALLNKEIELKLGYVGVINRSKKDLDDKLSIQDLLKKEEKFFKTHRIYKNLPQEYLGSNNLINKLSKIYFTIIKNNLPQIIVAINERINEIKNEMDELGNPLPKEESSKMTIIINMVNEYSETFKNILQGKYNNKIKFLEKEGGFKIREYFNILLKEFIYVNYDRYKATKNYTDDYIKSIINIYEGHTIPGFPSVDSFYHFLKPEIEKLNKPINECFDKVVDYLYFLSKKILDKTFIKYPQLLSNISIHIDNFLEEKKNKTKFLIDSIIDMETNYLFTNDQEYLDKFSSLCKDNEIRNRIDSYFSLVVHNLRESIPKIIGNFLLKEIENNLQNVLINKIYNSKELVNLLVEPDKVIKRRNELNDIMNIMKNAQNIIRNNPEFINDL